MYSVTVQTKTEDHPYYGMGSKKGYVINGKQGPTLFLKMGETYQFKINTPNHPFYFTTSDTGAMNGKDDGALSEPLESGTLSFTMQDDFPSEFYYQCDYHPKMGGKVQTIVSVNNRK